MAYVSQGGLQRSGWFAVAVALSAALLLVGPACGDDPPATGILITAPTDGAMLTLLDDVDPVAPGLQINVVAETALTGTMDLYLDAMAADGTPDATAVIDGSGVATFTGITLAGGAYAIQARLGEVRSPVVNVIVEERCADVSWVLPMPDPMGGNVHLGPSDDTSGEACGDTFTTDVTVATSLADGTEAQLIVSGSPRGTAVVSAATLRWTDVVFGSRAPMTDSLEVEVAIGGRSCREPFPGLIEIDCDGVSCVMAEPSTASMYLNGGDDVSAADGFQVDFVVDTDVDGTAMPIQLIIDGRTDEALEETAIVMGMGAAARFGAVDLEEGERRVEAVCSDAAGNVTRSGVSTWTVDITPCTVAVLAPDGSSTITPADDLDPATAGIQIDVSGTEMGGDCTTFTVGACSAGPGARVSLPGDGTYSGVTTLGSAASQELCAWVDDVAGNIGEARVIVPVRSEAPGAEITTPATGSAYNIAGTMGRTADLVPATPACEVPVAVNCEVVGETVTLRRQDTGTELGNASCVAMAGLPAPYEGTATFAMVALPSQNDGASYAITAEQTVSGLTGISAPVSVTADCQAPALTVGRPTCGATLRPSTDDEDTTTPGFQYRVSVFVGPAPEPDVALLVNGSAATPSATSSTPGGVKLFDDTNLPGGTVDLQARATDSADNTGTSPVCTVTVEDIPVVSITAPSNGDVLTTDDDCSAAAGLQITVSATTDAADGATAASITVGGGAPVMTAVSGGVVSACVDAPDGRPTITVTVTDPVKGTAMASVDVIIDTMPPVDTIADLMAAVADRRGGLVDFTWTAVNDAGGGALSRYELRCAGTAITNEAEWAAATAVPGTLPTPGGAGTVETARMRAFQTGTTVSCVIRGFDAADKATPLPSSNTDVTLDFLEQAVSAAGSGQLGFAMSAIGDVNGDGIDDVAIGSNGGDVWLYFGSDTGLSATPQVRIVGPGSGSGQTVTGLGDFNGDGIDDFAMAAAFLNGFDGEIYLFYGRPSTSPWPSSVNLTLGGCQADACFAGAGAGFFGWRARAAGDFDGDGKMDLVIGAPAVDTEGAIYVILGDSSFAANAQFDVPAAMPSLEPRGFFFNAAPGWMQFGNAVSSVGDSLGSDGRDDLVIGAPGSTVTLELGRIVSIAGRAYPAAGVGLQAIPAGEVATIDTGAAGRFAFELTPGDFDGNGTVDIAAVTSWSTGLVTVYVNDVSGGFAGTSWPVTNDVADPSGDQMGYTLGEGFHPALGALGDLDGNGAADMLTGSSQRGTALGSVDLWYAEVGVPSEIRRSEASSVFDPTTAESSSTRTAAYVGDVNGDGDVDLAVGDRSAGGGAGRVLIYY